MINLFENYSQGSWDLHYSLIVAGYVNTTVCLSDKIGRASCRERVLRLV